MSQDQRPPEPQPESDAERLERKIHGQPSVAPNRWVTRIVAVIALLLVGYLAYKLAAAFFPRWWAQRVADQVQGGMTAGTLWGLFYGFTFTLVPLLVLAQVRRRFLSWTWRGIVALVAVALAAPNWLTLAVVAGNSSAAHAGERIFDVDAPGFRAATLIGVVAGAVVAVLIVAASLRLARRKKQVAELKGERDALREREKEHEREDRDGR